MTALFAAFFALIAPIALFIMIPGASMFWFYVPIWLAIASACLAVGAMVGGQRGVLIGSGVLVALATVAFLGPVVALEGPCLTLPKAPSRQVLKPARIVLDGVGPGFVVSKGEHDPRDMVAVIAGAEVIEISRMARGHIGSASVLQARPLADCQHFTGRTTIRTNASQDHRVDFCLTESKFKGFDDNSTTELRLPYIGPTVEFVGSAPGGSCKVVRVYERTKYSRRLIARFILTRSEPFLRPDPENRRLQSGDYWLTTVMKYVLGDGLSEAALRPLLR